MKYENLMVDIETLSDKPEALILSIGAIFFDDKTEALGPTFYQLIDIKDSQRQGFHINAETVLWWMEKDDGARKSITDNREKSVSVTEALRLLSEYIAKHSFASHLKLWGNGSDFDNVILAQAYNRIGQEAPWYFYNNRCYRTLKNLHRDIKFERIGTHHNALDDAVSQAKHAIQILSAPAGYSSDSKPQPQGPVTG